VAFGLSWHHLGFGDNELDHVQNDVLLSLGYRPFKYFSIGGNVKYLSNSTTLDGIVEGNARGWGFDLGLLLAASKNLRLGLMMHDATDTKLRYDNDVRETLFYRNIRYGAAYMLKDFGFLKSPLLAIDLDDRLHLGAEFWLQNVLVLRAGVQKDLYKGGEDQLTYSFGAGLHYKFLQLDFACTDSPFLQNTSTFSVTLHFDPPPSPVRIEQVEIEDIYASQIIHHSNTPWARVKLSYDGDKPIECKLTLAEKPHGLRAEQLVKIDPAIEKDKIVELEPIVPNQLLRMAVSQREETYAAVVLEPKTVIATKAEKTLSPGFSVLGLNNIDWRHGVAPAAAFIVPEDGQIRQFAALAQRLYDDHPGARIINRNISLAANLFNLLSQYGIRYKFDPNSPREELDTIQYPFELLRTKQGDCDDTTVLLASLLESLGIRTALLDIPRHLLLMFDTGIHETHRMQLGLSQDHYVIYDRHVWLPVETTILGETFWNAWQMGVQQYHKFTAQDKFVIVEVHRAWEQYHRPVYIDYAAEPLPLPDEKSVASVCRQEYARHLQAQESFLAEKYYEPLKRNPHDLTKKNELAMILNFMGKKAEAREIYRTILSPSSVK
jgi:hypothetical protein